jgi:hypothetical protein
MEHENGVTAVEQKFMNEGSLFGLRFRSGYIFFEVTGWEQVKYEPYNNIGDVDPGSNSGFTRLENSSGDDILFVEKGEGKILHTAIGMEPGFMRRYTNFPEGENRLRSVPNLGTPIAGDDYGFVDGEDSPYHEPTDIEELLIPPGSHLDFNFYNPSNRVREPVLSILMRVYDIRVLKPNREDDSNSIKRIVSPGSPMPIYPVGSVRNQARYGLGDNWGVTTMTRQQAKSQ